MSDTPPTPTPKNPAKGIVGKLKGKPAWMYVAGITIIIGVAWFIHRRSNTAVDDGSAMPVDDTTGSVGDNSLFPSASQGAYGGYSDPGTTSTGDTGSSPTDNAGNPETPTVNVYIPGPSDNGGGSIPAASDAGAASITGGGTQPARTTAQHLSPQDVNAKITAAIKAIQAANPAHAATTPQVKAQVAAKAATPTAVFTQDAGTRSGLQYKLTQKNGKWYRFYESKPGKGDWGEGGKVLRP